MTTKSGEGETIRWFSEWEAQQVSSHSPQFIAPNYVTLRVWHWWLSVWSKETRNNNSQPPTAAAPAIIVSSAPDEFITAEASPPGISITVPPPASVSSSSCIRDALPGHHLSEFPGVLRGKYRKTINFLLFVWNQVKHGPTTGSDCPSNSPKVHLLSGRPISVPSL